MSNISILNAKDSINDLYISTRKKFIRQKSDGTYSHSDGFKSKMVLTDELIINHLKDEETIGIFCSKTHSKFVTFDIDAEMFSESFRREMVIMLKQSIFEKDIPRECINVSISGNKGYHLTIFFTDVVTLECISKFYHCILEELNLSSTQVELYPRFTNGLKLPLGTHQLTKNKCWFVDDNFNKIEDIEYLSKVVKMDRNHFQDIVKEIKPSDDIKKQMNAIFSDYSDNKIPMLGINRASKLEEIGLTEPSTRNYSIVQLCVLYNTLGVKKEDAVCRLNDWMDCQNPKFFKTHIQACYKENSKVVNWVYSKNIRFAVLENKKINIYKREIEILKNIKNKRHRHTLFVLLCHYKRYMTKDVSSFYMAYSQIAYNSNISINKSIKDSIEFLEANGYIEVVKKSYYDKSKKRSDTNVYRILFDVCTEGRSCMSIKDYSIPYMYDIAMLDSLYIL